MSLYTGNIVATQQLTIANVATALELSELSLVATAVRCSVEGGGVRVRVDGGTPTETFGHLESNGSHFTVVGSQNVKDLRLIAADDETSAQVTCSLMVGASL